MRDPSDRTGEAEWTRSVDNQPQAQSQLIIICGLSFAGKTTLGNAICARFGYPQVDVDETKVELYGRDVVDRDLSGKQWTEMYRETDARIARHLRNGASVVDASRNFQRHERDAARDIARSAGADAVVVYVDTPEPVVRQRWLANRVSQARRDVSDGNFEEIVAVMQPPCPEERAVVFRHDEDIENWLTEHAERLGP